MKMRITVFFFLVSLGALANEIPVALWGTWMSPCHMGRDESANTWYERTFYTFDSEDRFSIRTNYYVGKNCTGQPLEAIPIEGIYYAGSEENGGTAPYFPIDLELQTKALHCPHGGTCVPGQKYFQIYTVNRDKLYFGKTWSQQQSNRPNELDLNSIWYEVSP